MPARNIQIAAAAAIVAVIVVVIAVTQLSGDSGGTPTPGPQETSTVPAAISPSPGTSPTASPEPATPGATVTPSPTDTATATPSPTSTPLPPDATIFAILKLSEELNAPASEFTVLSYEQATWPTAAYGCPVPGILYAQSEVEGWSFEIGYQDQVFEFHSDIADALGETLVNCNKNRSLLEGTINIVELAGLRSTTEIEMWRLNGEGGYDLWTTETDAEDIQAIVDTLDVPLALSPAASCNPLYELVFKTPEGDQTFRTVCGGGRTELVRGEQGFWEGMDGTAPSQFSNILGPYYSDVNFPGFPSPTAQ